MSILIKGLDIPTPPDELRLIIRPNGQVIICHRTEWDETEAVNVPPHGRLIDEDAIYNCDPLYRMITYQGNWVYSRKAIQYAPTIVEAEVSE